MRIAALMASSLLLTLGACTWVKPDERGRHVEVAYFGVSGQCQNLGEITVSVADRVAGVRRSEMKVKDELESLARNKAPKGANTIEPIAEPVDGEQRFRAWRC